MFSGDKSENISRSLLYNYMDVAPLCLRTETVGSVMTWLTDYN